MDTVPNNAEKQSRNNKFMRIENVMTDFFKRKKERVSDLLKNLLIACKE